MKFSKLNQNYGKVEMNNKVLQSPTSCMEEEESSPFWGKLKLEIIKTIYGIHNFCLSTGVRAEVTDGGGVMAANRTSTKRSLGKGLTLLLLQNSGDSTAPTSVDSWSSSS